MRIFRSWHGVDVVFAEVLLTSEINGCLQHGVFGLLPDFVKRNLIRTSRILVFVEILVGLAFVFGVVTSVFVIMPCSFSCISKSHALVNWIPGRVPKLPTGLEHLSKITLQTVLFLLGGRLIVCQIGGHLRLLVSVDGTHFEISLHLHVFCYGSTSPIESSLRRSKPTTICIIGRIYLLECTRQIVVVVISTLALEEVLLLGVERALVRIERSLRMNIRR